MTRKIIHIDCDCFYAAVEVLDNPALRGRPVAVGGDPGKRGVIAACNYEARHFDIHSALPSARAMYLCPELVILPPRFDRYRAVSRAIHHILRRYTDRIEPLSLDEAYLDVTESMQCDNSATRIATALRRAIHQELGITVSAGVAPNKFLAKVASDWDKPDGLCVIPPERVQEFVAQLPVKRVFGVGRVTAEKLEAMGVQTCADLQRQSRLALSQTFGSFGERLYQLARGQDDRPVQTSRRRKSVSVEKTFDHDLPRLAHWQAALPDLMERLQRRLARLEHSYLVSGLTAKVRYSDFALATTDGAGHQPGEEAFAALFENLWERRAMPARLLGIGVRLRDMDAPEQPDLFPEERRQALALQRSGGL